MKEINFQQLEPGISDVDKTYFHMRDPIATFPIYLRGRFPMDEKFIYSTLKNNLNGYIQKIEDLINNPKKLKELINQKKKIPLRVIKFDKVKLIEFFFAGFFITSIILLTNLNTFIYGFILNIISVVVILILSFINLEAT